MELIYSSAPSAVKQKWVERMKNDNSGESCGFKNVQWSLWHQVTIFWEMNGFLKLGLRLQKKKKLKVCVFGPLP